MLRRGKLGLAYAEERRDGGRVAARRAGDRAGGPGRVRPGAGTAVVRRGAGRPHPDGHGPDPRVSGLPVPPHRHGAALPGGAARPPGISSSVPFEGVLMVGLVLTIAAATVAAAPPSAWEIPAFARKYGVSCNLCHSPIPRLTAFGETFAANGFRMSSLEPVRDTIDTGDPLLEL